MYTVRRKQSSLLLFVFGVYICGNGRKTKKFCGCLQKKFKKVFSEKANSIINLDDNDFVNPPECKMHPFISNFLVCYCKRHLLNSTWKYYKDFSFCTILFQGTFKKIKIELYHVEISYVYVDQNSYLEELKRIFSTCKRIENYDFVFSQWSEYLCLDD